MQAPSPVNEPAAESPPPSSNRQEKKRKHIFERDDRKRRRGDGQQKIRAENNLVETEAHFWYVQPACPPRDKAKLAGKDREEATKRVLHRIRHTKAITNVAILNPNYKEGAETPRHAAIRLSEVIGEEDQARLSKLIDALKDAGAKFDTTAAHGIAFQQFWLGIWRKYSKAPAVSRHRRANKKVDAAIVPLLTEIDRLTSKRAHSLLAEIDPATATRMRWSHRPIAKSAMRNTDKLRGGQKHDEWFDEDTRRAGTSAFRMGGIGSMLAVSISSGQGTDYHYDEGDDGHFYSAITVLETGGYLDLPELDEALEVKPGDMVLFLANQQLHKLTVDGPPNAVQKVLTLWTDKLSIQFAQSSVDADFFPATALANDKSRGKAKIEVDQATRGEALQKSLEHCHVVQPDDEDE